MDEPPVPPSSPRTPPADFWALQRRRVAALVAGGAIASGAIGSGAASARSTSTEPTASKRATVTVELAAKRLP